MHLVASKDRRTRLRACEAGRLHHSDEHRKTRCTEIRRSRYRRRFS